MSVEATVLNIIEEHFKLPASSITRATAAKDVPNWDSLSNVTLLLKCEKFFDIRFDALDLVKIFNVGDFIDLIDHKQSS